MSNNLSDDRALRHAFLCDLTPHSIPQLLSVFGRKGIDTERTASLAAERGRTKAHQIARLDVLIAKCELQQSGGFTDGKAVTDLYREAEALWNRYRWEGLTLPELPDELTFPYRIKCIEAVRARAEEKVDELEGRQKSQPDEAGGKGNQNGTVDPLIALQRAILKALDGKSLKVEKLAEACKVQTSRFYKPNGLKELKSAGKVKLKRGVGYYRPDRPPLDDDGEQIGKK